MANTAVQRPVLIVRTMSLKIIFRELETTLVRCGRELITTFLGILPPELWYAILEQHVDHQGDDGNVHERDRCSAADPQSLCYGQLLSLGSRTGRDHSR